MDTDELHPATAAAAPTALAPGAPAGTASQRPSDSAPAVSKQAAPASDDDDDDDDDDSDDSSFHGSDDESGSGDDSDSDAGGKSKRGDRKVASRKSRAAGDAADAAAQDFDFGIDADELRDVREAAIEMYGEGILREGADSNAGGGTALSKETLDKLWSDMLSEALLPTSIRALEQGAVGADGAPNALQSVGPRKRRYLALSGPASAGALSAVDRALLKANSQAPSGSAAAKRARAASADGDGTVSALLDQVQAFGAPLEAAAESCSKARPAAVSVSAASTARSEAAALRAAMASTLQGKASTTSSTAGAAGDTSAATAERPYFVTCDRSDVLGRPAPQTSGAGLWMRSGSAGVQPRRAAAALATALAAPLVHDTKEVRSAASRAREEASARTEAVWAAVSTVAPSAIAAACAAADVDANVPAQLQPRAGRRAPSAAAAIDSASVDADGLRSRLMAAAAAARETLAGRRIAVKQTVKFAGQTITVTKLVDAGTQAAKTVMAAANKPAAAAAAGKAGHADAGLGAAAAAIGPFASAAGAGASSSSGGGAGGGGGVGIGAELANLDRPDAISTLAKSSLDWDSYKATQNLDDELAGAAKEGVGYVGKQAFLARVEQRQDDAALAKRALERARASAASAAAASSGF